MAPGKSYASITKGAGVRCTDAQTQTDITYDLQLSSKASGDCPLDKMQVVMHPKQVQEADHALHKKLHLSLKRRHGASLCRPRRGDQNNAPKKKIDTDRLLKGADDPLNHTAYMMP